MSVKLGKYSVSFKPCAACLEARAKMKERMRTVLKFKQQQIKKVAKKEQT